MRDHHDVDEGDADIDGVVRPVRRPGAPERLRQTRCWRMELPNACDYLDADEGNVYMVGVEMPFNRVVAP